MDRKPKARRVASEEPVRDDPEQSERFIKAAQDLNVDLDERKLEVVVKTKRLKKN